MNICVYCGSANGTEPHFVETAEELGRRIGAGGHGLVYGGGDNGLMGKVARSTLAAGGRVVGIIPDFLKNREHMLQEAQELVVVPDMHTRKRLMFERADAFVALPGGVGTLEEVVEQITWMQLGRHKKPILLANVQGFWDPLCALFDHMKALEFINSRLDFTVLVTDTVGEILPMLRDFAAKVPEEAKKMEPTAAERL